MKVMETIISNETTEYNGNGLSYKINLKANKCTINWNHYSNKDAMVELVKNDILNILKPHLLIEK